jgi:hypothetical protein
MVMEEKIDILIQYGKADLDERLNLFLEFPDLRRSFQGIELRDRAAQTAFQSSGRKHNKGRYSRRPSFIGRITDIETWCNLLRLFPVS